MKCAACGAIGSSSRERCDFCGTNLISETEKPIDLKKNELKINQINPIFNNIFLQIKDSITIITDLSKSPHSRFNIWAFLFNVSYLWGMGAKKNAKSVAIVFVFPAIIVFLISFIFENSKIATVALFFQFIWFTYVLWLISTRSQLLVKNDQKFDWTQGVIAFFVFNVTMVLLS